MLFNTPLFLFVFMPATFLCYFMLVKFRLFFMGNLFLVLCSLFFYGWGNPAHVGLLLFCGIFNYIVGLLLSSVTLRKLIFILALLINIGILILFKYAGMLADGIIFIGGEITSQWNFIQNIALPLGISFYTFQGISYIIDVYHQQILPQRNIVDFLAYLCMFPQLVAGPIVRYSEIAASLGERTLESMAVAEGCRRFIYGLAKKCLLADTFGKIADACFDIPPSTLSGEAAWLGMFCYSLQIFFDFSAYSDMAIGMGHMLGFTFPENFNAPYLAKSVREFWQRWHMSLTRWLRDYIYIPLGGNRISLSRTCLNMMVVFLICGLWHGASANFLLWGAYFGCFLVLERLMHNKPMQPFIGHAYTLLVVMAGWVLFRAPDLGAALGYYRALAFMNGVPLVENVDVLLAIHGYYPKIAMGCAVFLILVPTLPKFFFLKRTDSSVLLAFEYLWVLVLLYVSTMMIFGATHRYFIYFRF